MPVVAITHTHSEVPSFYNRRDLDALSEYADVRILGGNDPKQIAPQLVDVDILTGAWGFPRLDAALLAAAPRLRAACYAAGTVKGFATPEAYARGLTITSAWMANAIPVAEATVALITLSRKRWFSWTRTLHKRGAGEWKPFDPFAAPGNFGTTVGLIGLGAIGRLVAERLRSYDVKVLAYDPFARPESATALGIEMVAELAALARRSDVVSLHAADVPANMGMIGAAFFAAMRDETTFINTARGRLVDHDALAQALATRPLYAHLDVTHPEPLPPDSPLWTLPNCWLTPHLAGSMGTELQRLGRFAVQDAIGILRGETPRSAVSQDMLTVMA